MTPAAAAFGAGGHFTDSATMVGRHARPAFQGQPPGSAALAYPKGPQGISQETCSALCCPGVKDFRRSILRGSAVVPKLFQCELAVLCCSARGNFECPEACRILRKARQGGFAAGRAAGIPDLQEVPFFNIYRGLDRAGSDTSRARDAPLAEVKIYHGGFPSHAHGVVTEDLAQGALPAVCGTDNHHTRPLGRRISGRFTASIQYLLSVQIANHGRF